MDLLYKHIMNIPETETLTGIYLVDGIVTYASTKLKNSDLFYKLYEVINHNLYDYLLYTKTLSELDSIVAKRNSHVLKQSMIYEDDIRIVRYFTNLPDNINMKKPVNERQEINRYVRNNSKKLF